MNNQEQIEKLQQVIKDAQNMIEKLNDIKTKNYTGWERSELNDSYFCIDTDATIDVSPEDNDGIDGIKYNTANYFTNKNLAERIAFEQNLFRKLRRFADENNDKTIDWNDKDGEKYFIEYNYDSNEIQIDSYSWIRHFGQISFTNEDVVRRAIKTFESELLQYFTYNFK